MKFGHNTVSLFSRTKFVDSGDMAKKPGMFFQNMTIRDIEKLLVEVIVENFVVGESCHTHLSLRWRP